MRAVLDGSMPPWGADPRFGRFSNDPALTPAERSTIVRWALGGAPRGSGSPPPLPNFAHGWNHPDGRPPDVILEFPFEFQIPAEGTLPNINIYSPLPEPLSQKEHFIEAVQLMPQNVQAMHHASLSTRTLPQGVRLGKARLQPGGPILQNVPIADRPEMVGPAVPVARSAAEAFSSMGTSHLVYYFPGNAGLAAFPPGAGKRIRPGDYIEWGLHYTPSGRPQVDWPRAGLWLHKKRPPHEVITMRVGDFHIVNGKEIVLPSGVETTPGHASIVNVPADCDGTPCLKPSAMLPSIPAHAQNWKVTAITPFVNDVTLYSANPHGHFRLTDMTYVVTYPDGREETLLSVPHYDFSRQLFYHWAEPVRLPAGSTIKVIGHFDNSRRNRANPDPEQPVHWGEQSTEEMYNGFIELSVDQFADLQPRHGNISTQAPLVLAVGCALEDSRGWHLTRVSRPRTTTVAHADAGEMLDVRRLLLGRDDFRLIGTAEFGDVAHYLSQGQRAQFTDEIAANVTGQLRNGHKTAVKGLLIANGSLPTLNLLSVESLSPECH